MLLIRWQKRSEKSPSSFDSLSLKDPERTIPMLRGRSASDTVLPRGDAPYSSIEASCVGMLLDRVILGGPPTGLGTVIRNRSYQCSAIHIKQMYACQHLSFAIIVCVLVYLRTHAGLWGSGQGGGRRQQWKSERVGHTENSMRVPPLSFLLPILLDLGGTAETTV